MPEWKNEDGDFTLEIDHGKCDGDGACADSCPVEVFEIKDGKAHASNMAECIECCACVDACPLGAIKHSSC